jgi:hypothetical protein
MRIADVLARFVRAPVADTPEIQQARAELEYIHRRRMAITAVREAYQTVGNRLDRRKPQ